jgi:DNA-binding PadR family transcriptional regulator
MELTDTFWSGRGFGRGIWDERTSPVEFLVLLLLNEEPTHGYDIMQTLAEKFSGLWSPKPGTVYPALSRLEEKGLIKIREGDSGAQSQEGQPEYPPKKIYILTEKGTLALKNIISKMEFEEKLIDRFRGIVDQSVWQTFDNMASKRIEGHIERALTGAARAVADAVRVLSPQDSIRELEFYRDQLRVELEDIEKKLKESREKEKKFRKVEIE